MRLCILVSTDVIGSNVIEETWSTASVPLTNGFRYNMTESLPFVPQSPPSGYDGYVSGFYFFCILFLTSFESIHWQTQMLMCQYYAASRGTTWTASVPVSIPIVFRPTTCQQVRGFLSLWEMSHCSTVSYRRMSDHFLCFVCEGNGNYQNAFSCPESQTVTHSHQPVWGENGAHDMNSTWDTGSCVGSKVRFTKVFVLVKHLKKKIIYSAVMLSQFWNSNFDTMLKK